MVPTRMGSAVLVVLSILATQAPDAPAPAAATPAPAAATPAAAQKPRVVLLELAARGVEPGIARTLDESLSVAFSRSGMFDIITSADLRAVLDVEATRSAMGACSGDNGACMSEIAEALGADAVVHGSLAVLEQQTILTVNMFDARTNRAAGREQAIGANATELLGKIDPLAASLTRAWLGAHVAALPEPAPAATEPVDVPRLALLGGGGVLAAGGLAVGVVGVLSFLNGQGVLEDPTSSGADKVKAGDDYRLGTGLAFAGAGAVVVGAGLLVTSFVLE